MNIRTILVVSIVAAATAAPAVAQQTPAPRPSQVPRPLQAPRSSPARRPPLPPDISSGVEPLELVLPDVTAALEAAEQALQAQAQAQAELALRDFQLPPIAPLPPQPPRPFFGSQAQALYDQGRDAIEQGQYDRAIEKFDRLIEMKTKTTDAALYWKAYSLEKLGDRTKALTTLADLKKQYNDSRWIKDASALEVELRQASGQAVSPELQNNEELKLLALRGVMQNNPDQALPVIEKMLNGGDTLRLKEQALFVLSQSRVPRAKEIIAGVAKGGGNPDLQLRAIRYLGMMRASPELSAAYQSDPSIDVRKAIVNTLFQQRDGATLVALARAEKNAEMKREIVSRLSTMKTKEATDYLLELLK